MDEPVYSSCLDSETVIKKTKEKLESGVSLQDFSGESEDEADLYFNRKR